MEGCGHRQAGSLRCRDGSLHRAWRWTHRSAWEGWVTGDPRGCWPIALPVVMKGEGLMHQWSCQRSCLAGCREVRGLVFPIRPPPPRPRSLSCSADFGWFTSPWRGDLVSCEENQVVQMMPEGEKQL